MKRVTAALIERDSRFLITRRAPGEKQAGKWEFPGGKIEDGELPEECLKRELQEELGIEAEIGDFFAQSLYVYDHGEILLLGYYAFTDAVNLSLSVHDQAVWVSPEEMNDYDFAPADIEFVKKLQAFSGKKV